LTVSNKYFTIFTGWRNHIRAITPLFNINISNYIRGVRMEATVLNREIDDILSGKPGKYMTMSLLAQLKIDKEICKKIDGHKKGWFIIYQRCSGPIALSESVLKLGVDRARNFDDCMAFLPSKIYPPTMKHSPTSGFSLEQSQRLRDYVLARARRLATKEDQCLIVDKECLLGDPIKEEMINFAIKVVTTTEGKIKIIKHMATTPSIDYNGGIGKIKGLIRETILKARPTEVQKVFNVLKS